MPPWLKTEPVLRFADEEDPQNSTGWKLVTAEKSLFLSCDLPTPTVYRMIGPLKIFPYIHIDVLFDEFWCWLRTVTCLSLEHLPVPGRFVKASLQFELADWTEVVATSTFKAVDAGSADAPVASGPGAAAAASAAALAAATGRIRHKWQRLNQTSKAHNV